MWTTYTYMWWMFLLHNQSLEGAMRQTDGRTNRTIYRTFEEFEREELRRVDSVRASVDDIDGVASVFGEALDFERAGARKAASPWSDEDE
jgi:hypothetical protein